MDQSTGKGAVTDRRQDPLVRGARLAMVVYLSPLIFLVSAIGLVGVVASKWAASHPGTIRLVHRPHFGKIRTSHPVKFTQTHRETFEV